MLSHFYFMYEILKKKKKNYFSMSLYTEILFFLFLILFYFYFKKQLSILNIYNLCYIFHSLNLKLYLFNNG